MAPTGVPRLNGFFDNESHHIVVKVPNNSCISCLETVKTGHPHGWLKRMSIVSIFICVR